MVASQHVARLRWGTAALLLVVLAGALWLMREIHRTQAAVVHTNMRARLFQLSMALQNYCEWYGRLPPLMTEPGDPPHPQSWRVAAIRYADRTWTRYVDALPWDALENVRAGEEVRTWLQVGHLEPPAPRTTRILAIDGPGSPWRTGDASENRHLPFLAYVPESTVGLLEPRDLTLEELKRLAVGRDPRLQPVMIIALDGRPRELSPGDVELFEVPSASQP